MNKKTDLHIAVMGFIAIRGSIELIKNKRENLDKRFSLKFFNDKINEFEAIYNEAKKVKQCYNIIREKFDKEEKIVEIYEIRKGGFLSKLWESSELLNVGVIYNLKNVPVKQMSIEIADFFDINVYRLYSENSYIVYTDDLLKFEEYLYDKEGIDRDMVPISYIGNTNDTKKKIRVDGENDSYLNKDYKDDIDLVIKNFTKSLK